MKMLVNLPRPCTSATIAALLSVVILPDAVLGAERSTVRVSSREQLARALAQAEPGTTILLEPGTYRGGLIHRNLQGTREQPIVIAAADSAHPPVFEGGGGSLQLSDPAYVELRHLVFTGASGNGLNIDDGGSKETSSHHIRLIGLVIREIGPRGNRDGIKLSGVDDFLVQDCTIERWGDGGSAIDMVGCHRGTIDGCTFRHGEEADGANGVQTKGGTSEITIRRCHFERPGERAVNIGGSTGLAFFRPQANGYEAKAITVEDCTFIGSAAPIAFVGVDGATVRYNTIYRPGRWVVRILQETQLPEFVASRNGRFTNNVIAFRSGELNSAVNVGSHTAPETFVFADNHWYCLDRPERTQSLVRLPVTETGGTYDVDPAFVDPQSGNLEMRAEGIDAGARKSQQPSR